MLSLLPKLLKFFWGQTSIFHDPPEHTQGEVLPFMYWYCGPFPIRVAHHQVAATLPDGLKAEAPKDADYLNGLCR